MVLLSINPFYFIPTSVHRNEQGRSGDTQFQLCSEAQQSHQWPAWPQEKLLHTPWLAKTRQNTAWKGPALFVSTYCYCLCWLRLEVCVGFCVTALHRHKVAHPSMIPRDHIWFLVFGSWKQSSKGKEQRHYLYGLTESCWFCPREVTLSLIHSSLPSTATQHRIYSVETTLIKICNHLFLVQQSPPLPYFPYIDCHFQHKKQLLVGSQSPV